MLLQEFYSDRVYQVVGEPGLGSIVVGCVRYGSGLTAPTPIVTQRRRIQKLDEKKGWGIVRWYEETEQSIGYENMQQRPSPAQLLGDAGVQFRIVICSANRQLARDIAATFDPLAQLYRLGGGWMTADGSWNIDRAERESRQGFCSLAVPRPPRQQVFHKGVN